jgi:hypothetical protein
MFYDIYLYTLCYYICCLLGACMTCTWLCSLKPGVTAEQRLTRANGRLQRNSACLRAQKSEQAPEGAPDSEQDLSSAPPDCPVAQMLEAPTVKP